MSDAAPKHSRLSPSKAYQWTVCTASIGFIKANRDRLPPDVSSPAAIEGTKAHNVAEAILLGKPVPAYATKDMIHFGREYASFCKETRGPLRDVYDWGVEKRTPLFYLPEEKGTVDFWCWNKTGIHIKDFKYGYDPVESVKNKQMTSYALSLIMQLVAEEWIHGVKITDDTPVTLTIYQPRLGTEPDTWSTTVGELWGFARGESNIVNAAKLILSGGKGVFAPSEKTCKYCSAIAICEERQKWLLRDLEVDIFGEEPPAAGSLSEEGILSLYHKAGSIEALLKGVREYVDGKVKAGAKDFGLKVVLSRGPHRRWKDEAARQRAAQLLLEMKVPYDEIYSTDMCTPAQAETLTKHVKSAKLTELFNLWIKPPGAPIVVPENDPRPAHAEDYTKDFLEESAWD